jgi:Holliday junction resolvase
MIMQFKDLPTYLKDRIIEILPNDCIDKKIFPEKIEREIFSSLKNEQDYQNCKLSFGYKLLVKDNKRILIYEGKQYSYGDDGAIHIGQNLVNDDLVIVKRFHRQTETINIEIEILQALKRLVLASGKDVIMQIVPGLGEDDFVDVLRKKNSSDAKIYFYECLAKSIKEYSVIMKLGYTTDDTTNIYVEKDNVFKMVDFASCFKTKDKKLHCDAWKPHGKLLKIFRDALKKVPIKECVVIKELKSKLFLDNTEISIEEALKYLETSVDKIGDTTGLYDTEI